MNSVALVMLVPWYRLRMKGLICMCNQSMQATM